MFGLPTPGAARHMPFDPPPPALATLASPVPAQSKASSAAVLQQLEQLSDSIVACKILNASDLVQPGDPSRPAAGVSLNARSLTTAGVKLDEESVNEETGMITKVVEMEDERGNIVQGCLVVSQSTLFQVASQQQPTGEGPQAKTNSVVHLTGIGPWLSFQGAVLGDMLRIGSGKTDSVWSIRLLKRSALMAAKK